MKKMIAFGTAVSMLAVTAAVVGAEPTQTVTSLGIKSSLDEVKAGDIVTVTVYVENEGTTAAVFSIQTKGLTQVDPPSVNTEIVTDLNDEENGFSLVLKDGESFKPGDELCKIKFKVDDPTIAEITVIADEDVTAVGENGSWKAAAEDVSDSNGSDESEPDNSGSDESEPDNSGSDESEPDSSGSDESEPDNSGSGDSEPSEDSETSDSEPAEDDEEITAEEAIAALEAVLARAEEIDTTKYTEASVAALRAALDGAAGLSETATPAEIKAAADKIAAALNGLVDINNADTGVELAVVPVVLAAAGIVIAKKKK